MKTFDTATEIIESVNASAHVDDGNSIPLDGIVQGIIADDVEQSCVEFGRHILQIINRSVKKGHFRRVGPVTEEQGEELLKDMFESWNEDKPIKLKDDTIS